jgi:hypothetical protein
MVYSIADGSTRQRLAVGMVSGGRNAFIGAVHRLAMRLDDQITLVAGALFSDPKMPVGAMSLRRPCPPHRGDSRPAPAELRCRLVLRSLFAPRSAP